MGSANIDWHRYDVEMLDGESVDEALERIDQWERSAADRAERARVLAHRTAQLSATARSPDGLVEVTVGAEGQVDALHLAERTRQQPAATTAQQIMDTITAAKADLLRQFDEVTAETVGADSETGRMLMASLRRRLGAASDEPERGDR